MTQGVPILRGSAERNAPSLPRMVTCELSRVCWLRPDQHNRQRMQFTRRREKLVKSRRRPWAPLFPSSLSLDL